MRKFIYTAIFMTVFVVQFVLPLQNAYRETLDEWKHEGLSEMPETVLSYTDAATATEVLTAIGYYGDPEGCRMTAKQARQLADFVLMRYIIDGEEQPLYYFLLGDVAGDGAPYLHVEQYHKKDIIGSAWEEIVTDHIQIIASGEIPNIIFDQENDGDFQLLPNHPLEGPVLLANRYRPTDLDWIGRYYTFRDGEVHLAYQFDRIYNVSDTNWYITENGETKVYTSEEYHALTPGMRNDPFSETLVLRYNNGGNFLHGKNLTVSQLAEALNLYADFLEHAE